MNIPELIFWSCVMLLFYAYAGYPLLCLAASRLFPVRLTKADEYPSLSLVIACYNEERVIRSKLENSLALDYPTEKLQVIVASESTDSTNAIIAEYRSRGVELRSFAGRMGKSRMLSRVVPDCRGDIIAFSDANVMLSPAALKKIARNFADQRVGAVAGTVSITNAAASAISWAEAFYKRYETLLRSADSRRGSVLNPDGALFALRKELYRPISPDRGDDFELMLRVLLQKKLCVLEPEAVAFEEACISAGDEIKRKVRMVSWFLKSALILCAEACAAFRPLLALRISSHKLLRWFTPFFLLGSFSSSLILCRRSPLYLAVFIAHCAVILLGMAGRHVRKKKPPLALRASWYLLVFNYAFFVGVLKGLLPGSPSPFWEKSRI